MIAGFIVGIDRQILGLELIALGDVDGVDFIGSSTSSSMTETFFRWAWPRYKLNHG